MNEYFDKIYCINLDRREDKWLRTKSLLEKVGIEAERFSAVDGSKHMDTGIHFENMTNPEKACILSHLEVYKDALKNGYEKILILEDDVLPHKNINRLFMEHEELFDKANITWLGSNQFEYTHYEIKSHYRAIKNTWGSFAYMIKPALMKYLLKMNHFNTPMDGIMNQFDGIVIVPQLFISDVSTSDIRTAQDINKLVELNGWKIKDYHGLGN